MCPRRDMLKFNKLHEMDLDNKRVLVRVDYNVPMKEGLVVDDTRLRASVPTINKLLEHKCKIILMSHLGRPQKLLKKGKSLEEIKKQLTLKPVAEDLSEILGLEVGFSKDYFENDLPENDVVLLENIQFNPGEVTNDEDFAKKLSKLADIYVNDGFGQSHREYATFCAITKFMPSSAGLLVGKEIKQLSKLLHPEKPFVALIAGAKADKIGALKLLIKKADYILTGGALANTFLKAKGINIRASKYDEETFSIAKDILKEAGNKLILPVDGVVADKFEAKAETKEVTVDEIPKNWMLLDIGPKTIDKYKEILKDAKTILWAGPLGVFEMKPFSNGTRTIGEFIATIDATKIVGGGDSAAAIQSFNLASKMTHISTGGGASLEFIEKEGKLPAFIALEKAYKN